MLWLASTSPRRRDLLRAAGIAFELAVPGPEPAGEGAPPVLAALRARAKAEAASVPGGLVLGADTVVDLDGVELAKPADAAAAGAMLQRLAGREHRVHTAHCLVGGARGQRRERLTTARVRCEPLAGARLARYLASDAWRGKAGGYGIQDVECDFMHLLEGDLDTVIGLSVRAVRALLSEAGER